MQVGGCESLERCMDITDSHGLAMLQTKYWMRSQKQTSIGFILVLPCISNIFNVHFSSYHIYSATHQRSMTI